MRCALIVMGVVAVPCLAEAGKFGGFDATGARYLDGKVSVCVPILAADNGTAEGEPVCKEVDKRDVSALGFKRGKVARKLSGEKLAARVEGEGSIVITRGEDTLVTWAGAAGAKKVDAVFVSPAGDAVAVEYTVDKDTRVVAIDVSARLPREDHTAARAGNAYDRALGYGGKWEQSMIPCDTAGVKMTLKKTRRFTVRIETRCQGQKWVSDFDGKWDSEGDATLVLKLENDDGTEEAMSCTLKVCEGDEDCVTCTQEDIEFTLLPVRR